MHRIYDISLCGNFCIFNFVRGREIVLAHFGGGFDSSRGAYFGGNICIDSFSAWGIADFSLLFRERDVSLSFFFGGVGEVGGGSTFVGLGIVFNRFQTNFVFIFVGGEFSIR